MGILALAVAAVVIVALLFASKKAAPPCRLLAPSALAVCACAVALSATTYAWFTATTTSQVATIQSATYDVTVNNTPTENGVYTVQLDGSLHNITIKPTDNSTASVGYCKVELTKDNETETYYTPQIVSDKFTFAVNGFNGTLTITPQWGTCTATDDIINSTDSIPYGTSTSDLFMTPKPPEENPADATYPVSDDTETPETPVVPETQSAPPAPEPAVSETVPETAVE